MSRGTVAAGTWTRARNLLGATSLALLLGAPAATASPCFDLYVSSGGVEELAVGRTLALRALHPPPTCLPPPYTGKTKRPAPPAAMPLAWSVEPAALATITRDGVLTAVGPGQVVVRVACLDPEAPSCALTMPGTKRLNLYRELPGGRLPRLDGGPALEDLRIQWDATPFQSRHEIDVALTGAGFAWAAGFHTPRTPDHGFPWVLEAAEDRRSFDDEEGVDERSGARRRAYVTAARLTISSWKDGVVSGRIELKTTRGVQVDAPFQARLADRDGVLGKGAASAPKSVPARGPGTK
jgi:hypothetical protein